MGLGAITTSLFLLLTFTGVILMFYYIPAEDRAYDIMKDWQDTTPFAMMYRNMHRWSAHHDGAFCLSAYVARFLYRLL